MVEQSKNKQLKLQLEKLKTPTESNDDREPESIARKSVTTGPEGGSALVKAGIHKLVMYVTYDMFHVICYIRPLNNISYVTYRTVNKCPHDTKFVES